MGGSLHIGLTPWANTANGSARSLIRQAVLAEDLGYASFWLPESHFNGEGSIPEPLMWLAAVAGATERILLASTSYLLPLRHPVQAAEQVAVLDQLSNGRLILGVGRGFRTATFSTFNVEAGNKRQHFEDCLNAMRKAWRGEQLSEGNGDESITLAPQTAQKPHPPIWAAGFGAKGIRQAARLGLPYLASPIETLSRLQENYQHYERSCREAEREVPGTVPVMRTAFVCANGTERERVGEILQTQARQMRAGGIGRGVMPEDVNEWALLGELSEIRDKIDEYKETLGMSHLIVTRLRLNGLPDEMLESSVRQVARLID